MKRIRRIIIIISLVLCVVVAAVSGIYLMKDRGNGGVTEPDRAAMDEYLLDTAREKAPARKNAVWIKDGTDGSFTPDDEDFERSLEVIKQSVFDEVYIELQAEAYETEKEAEERLAFAVSKIKSLGKKAYAAFSLSQDIEGAGEYIKEADGVVLTGAEKASYEEINLKAQSVAELMKDKRLILCLAADYPDIQKLDRELIDEIHFTASEEGDAEKMLKAIGEGNDFAFGCNLGLSAVDGSSVTADVPLKNLYALREAKAVSTVVFDSLKMTRTNFHNCFGAVKTYITLGIVPELAFREVGLSGSSGEIITSEGYTVGAELYGSYLFPFFLDGRNIGSSANGNITATVDLMPGENTFTVKQNGSSISFRMLSECKEELVRSIIPSEDIYILPSESFDVTVIAHCNAEVYIKFGTQKIQARCERGATGFTAFSASVTAPATESEISSVGSMSVIASYGEKTVQYEGARVYPASVVPETTARPSTTLNAGNYNPTVTDDKYAVTQGITSQQNNSYLNQNITYTGNLMCVVRAPYADAKLISANDDYSPDCSPLVGGTMDYVVSESTYYNPEDDKEEYYYDLASGRKIKRENVDLVSTSGMGDNSLEVVSVISGLNKLQITLKTKWKVPYNIDYPGQNYYYSYKKNYNVTSFNASSVRMTFYHTASVSGSIDVGGSNVLSSAVWSTSAQDKTVTLTFGLKNQGGYYGSSLEYDANGNMVITVNRKPDSQTGYVVLLDPGHGGSEPGAVGLGSAVQERQINLDFALRVKQELESRGVTVYLTRTGNDKERDTLTLEQRKEITRSIKPDLYVSIHCNGSYSPDSIGTSTYYYEPYSYNLAKNIYDELLSVHKNRLYAGRQELYSSLADKVQFYPFSVTRVEDCPSTLIEVGYLTNDAECAMLAQPENQAAFGKAIADGIYKTLTS